MKMRRKVSTAIFLLLLWSTAASGSGIEATGTVAGYSARMVTTIQGRTSVAEIKGAPGVIRIEVQGGRTFSTMIANYDTGVVRLLAPVARQYLEMGLDSLGTGVPHFFRRNMQVERKKIGEEEVKGIPAIQYAAQITGSGGNFSGLLWEAKETLPLPLKWEDRSNNLEVLWENIASQQVADALFEVPPGYMKVEPEAMATTRDRKKQTRQIQKAESR